MVQAASGTLSHVTYDMTSHQFSDPLTLPANASALLNQKSVSLFRHSVAPDSSQSRYEPSS